MASKLDRARRSAAAVRKAADAAVVNQALATNAGAFTYGALRGNGVLPDRVANLDTGLLLGTAIVGATAFGAVPRRWRPIVSGLGSGMSCPFMYDAGFMLTGG